MTGDWKGLSSLEGKEYLGQTNPFRRDLLEGSTAIVTGGGSGIGRGIASALAVCGATVVVVGRRLERLESVVEELGSCGIKAHAISCDVRNPDAVEGAVDAIQQAVGLVDLLVNNAGATFTAPAEQLSPNGFRAVVETDAFGTFYMCQAVGRRLIDERSGGAILNITSTSPYTGNPGRVHGGMGKAAVESLTKSLAVEWGTYDIRVNSLAPGYTPTEGVNHATGALNEADVDKRADGVPLRRVGLILDIAWPAVFLLSRAASYITGASLVVDGGRWMSSGRFFDRTLPTRHNTNYHNPNSERTG